MRWSPGIGRQNARLLEQYGDTLDYLQNQGRLNPRTVTNLQATANTKARGVQISFQITSFVGVDSFVLLRNTTRDPGSAKQLHVWTAKSLRANPVHLPVKVSYSDTDQNLAGKIAYYWIRVVPTLNATQTNVQLVGPVGYDATATPGAPNVIADFAVSHQAASGGSVVIGVSVKPPVGDPRWFSTKIYVAGYNGVAAKVAVAQSEGTTFSFALKQTGETVTFTAVSVSSTGQENTTGPTASLTLNAGLTVPAKVMNATAIELGRGAGVQINWPNGPEPTLIQFHVYRGPKGSGFGAAAQIGTLAWSSGTSIFNFLDSNGLMGSFEWYVKAENASGLSAASDAIQTNATNTTADLTTVNAAATPTTSPLTSTTGGVINTATITIAAFQMQYPFGLVSYSGGSVTPLNDHVGYGVYARDPNYAGGSVAYIATTTPIDLTAHEDIVYIGSITTPVFGGGGTSGNGGGNGPCFSGNTMVMVANGRKPISMIEPGDQVLTRLGMRHVLRRIEHHYEGPIFDMGGGELVTPNHRLLSAGKWRRADEIFENPQDFKGTVYNLEIAGDSDDEHCYRLVNGWLAHNANKILQ